MMTFLLKTYGCAMNTYESGKIADLLLGLDLTEASDIHQSDFLIINSCSIRQAAEDSVYGWGLVIKDLPKKPVVILMGCLTGAAKSQRRRYELSYLQKKAPWVDYFWTFEEAVEKLPTIVKSNRVASVERNSTGLVSISRGCDNFCTYCVVPYARGPEKSRPLSDIIEEVEKLVTSGQTEIILLGQNVNSWGKDFTPPERFSYLVKKVHAIKGITKVSFLSSNPYDFEDDLIAVLKLPKVDRYLHLPVQSGDDEILRKMNRRHTREEYLELVVKIKKAVPEIRIGTDIIVGFPGETDGQFGHTLDLIKEVGFKQIFVAMYSPRKGTVAAETMMDDVPSKVKRQRHKEVLDLIKKISKVLI
ncbi:MAG: MiaB/RimO family radical SAM methylthiotransferase [candidate division WWE3 bacterium]|nr:MiaB/RimO family radical SAM methylthiotransferase [candidate division WWE3 bacterium]